MGRKEHLVNLAHFCCPVEFSISLHHVSNYAHGVGNSELFEITWYDLLYKNALSFGLNNKEDQGYQLSFPNQHDVWSMRLSTFKAVLGGMAIS